MLTTTPGVVAIGRKALTRLTNRLTQKSGGLTSRKLKLMSLMLLGLSAYESNAQQIIQTPSVQAQSTVGAPRVQSIYSRGVALYTAAELAGIGGPESLSRLGFVVNVAPTATVTGNLKIYLQNTTGVDNLKSATWTSAITGMTLVYDGPYNLAPGVTGGVDVLFNQNGGVFNYTGGALYMAFDYEQTSTPLASTTVGTFSVNLANNSATTPELRTDFCGTNTQPCNAPPATLSRAYDGTTASSIRGVIRLGLTQFANDLAVTTPWTLGKAPLTYGYPTVVRTTVTNYGTATQTQNITLNITGANSFTDTKSVTLAPGATTTVSFDPFTATNTGTNTVTVSSPNDGRNSNNTASVQQNTNGSVFSYSFNSNTATGAVGFASPGGVAIVNRYTTSAPRAVEAVRAFIGDISASGRTMYAILLDANGNFIGRTPNKVISGTDIGTLVTFAPATAGADIGVVPAGDFYVGIVQTYLTGGTAQYFPFSYQTENPIRPDAYYSVAATGGTPTAITNRGTFVIEAVVGAPPVCAQPTQISMGTITNNSATVNFTEGANGTNYIIEYGVGTFTPGQTPMQGLGTATGTGSPITINGLSAGTQYTFYITKECAGGIFSTYAGPRTFTTKTGAAPANDVCSGAITLVSATGASCAGATTGTTENASPSATLSTCAGPGTNDDVFYKFVATSTQHNVAVTGAANFDAIITAFSGTCAGTLTEIGCQDFFGDGATDNLQLTGLTIGQTYYVAVSDYNQVPVDFTFNICVTKIVPAPANNTCANATALTVSPNTTMNPIPGNTAGATQSIAAINCGGFVGNADDDVFYKFVATQQVHTITVVGGGSASTGFDAVVDLRQGACNGTNRACADATINGGTEVITANGLTIGDTYYIRVYDFNTGYGVNTDFTIAVSTPPQPPVNDDCTSPTTLTQGAAAMSGTTSNATQYRASCYNGGNADDDVWYEFTATTANPEVVVVGASAFSAAGEIRTACGGGGQSLVCNAVAAGGTLVMQTFGLTIGNTYLVRVFHLGAGSSTTPTFTIQVRNAPAPTAACAIAACTAGGIAENEACGVDANGACFGGEPIAIGSSICGNVWAANGLRDLDYYTFTVPVAQTLRFAAASSQPVNVEIYNSGSTCSTGAANLVSTASTSTNCQTASVTALLAPGTYTAIIYPTTFAGNPCGSGRTAYKASLTVAPTAPLSGAVTINKNAPASATNFQSFAALANRLTAGGVGTSVTASVVAGSGPYNEQVIFGSIPNVTATKTVTITGNGNTLTATPDRSNLSVIRIDGADFLTISGLNITVDPAATRGWGIELGNDSRNVTISGNQITTNATSTLPRDFMGIVATSNHGQYNFPGNNVTNLTISTNTITGGYEGIRINGNNTAFSTGINISGNTVTNAYKAGIFVQYLSAPVLNANIITMRSGNVISRGIHLEDISGAVSVQRNKVTNMGMTGLYFLRVNTAGASITNGPLIANNMVGGGFQNAVEANGILLNDVDYGRVYFNSVNVDNANMGIALDVYKPYSTGLDIRNNSLAYVGGGTGYAMRIAVATVVTTLNYNNYYSNGVNFVYYDRANRPTLDSLKNTVPKPTNFITGPASHDQNSKSGNPNYVSATNLHATGTQLANSGIGITGVTTDFDNQARSGAAGSVDIGADEFASPARLMGMGADGSVAASAYPNPVPAGANLMVSITAQESGQVQYLLTDLVGRVVMNVAKQVEAGSSVQTLDMNTVSKGLYILTIQQGGESTQVKIVKE